MNREKEHDICFLHDELSDLVAELHAISSVLIPIHCLFIILRPFTLEMGV